MSNLMIIHNAEHLTALVKSIVPRSFEKTFGGLSTGEVVAGFAFCTMGLTQTELNTGLFKVKETGYCPDPAVFAKWCKGLDGFDNTNAIADTYIGKAGALANIIKWLSDDATPITVAQKQAYDETFHMFAQISYAGNATQATYEAHSAYKDTYEHIVNQLIKGRVPCQDYIPPVAISQSTSQPQEPKHIPASDEFVDALFKRHGFKGLSGINKMETIA